MASKKPGPVSLVSNASPPVEEQAIRDIWNKDKAAGAVKIPTPETAAAIIQRAKDAAREIEQRLPGWEAAKLAALKKDAAVIFRLHDDTASRFGIIGTTTEALGPFIAEFEEVVNAIPDNGIVRFREIAVRLHSHGTTAAAFAASGGQGNAEKFDHAEELARAHWKAHRTKHDNANSWAWAFMDAHKGVYKHSMLMKKNTLFEREAKVARAVARAARDAAEAKG